ncbi:hypothetical protein ACMGDM_15840 [Sphingomonas sp. DT-51]|uniref:hypothetical protein n=1 Tax=Sphingomonas sp. DT-51 TaxID=3396165 RepID=UPI003F1D9F17
MRFHLSAPVALCAATLLAACARHAAPPPTATVAPPPVVALVPAPLPAGGRPGMTIPPRLADGSYPTPNRALSAAGAVWHLRSALNVAALACRGAQETTIIAQYNALIATRKAELASAQATLQAEYRAGGGDWQDRFDDQMTRLYNFFAQDLARDAFCGAAAETLGTIGAVPAATLPTFAAERLATLERPFTEFFAAYDRWRAGQLVPASVAAAGPVTPAG